MRKFRPASLALLQKSVTAPDHANVSLVLDHAAQQAFIGNLLHHALLLTSFHFILVKHLQPAQCGTQVCSGMHSHVFLVQPPLSFAAEDETRCPSSRPFGAG